MSINDIRAVSIRECFQALEAHYVLAESTAPPDEVDAGWLRLKAAMEDEMRSRRWWRRIAWRPTSRLWKPSTHRRDPREHE